MDIRCKTSRERAPEPVESETSSDLGIRVPLLRVTTCDCEHCGLRRLVLLKGARASDLARSTRCLRNGLSMRGSTIYSAGQRGAAVYTIRVGLVKLVSAVPGRGTRIVRLLGRGAALGLEVLGGSAYAHSAVALRTTNLCEIPISAIDELSDHNRDVTRGVMSKWNDEMTSADFSIALLGSGTVTERLIGLVRLIAEISGDRTDAVELPSVADMASLVGASPEGVSRHMAELKRAGILTRLAPRLYRCDPAMFGGSAGASISRAENPLPSRPVNVDSTSLN